MMKPVLSSFGSMQALASEDLLDLLACIEFRVEAATAHTVHDETT